jgi:uncharacterized protein YggU (UPF0235/DUF167 family)
MRIFVTVKTGARVNLVERVDVTHFRVTVKALPHEGKANIAVEKILAKFLSIARSQLTLKTGATGKQKVFVLNDYRAL